MIVCKSRAELEKMRAAGKVLAHVLSVVGENVAPGVSLLDLEAVAEKEIANAGAKPAFKGYRGYPCVLCTSVNDEVIHGIPSKRKLETGDIASVDCGVILDGYYADSAVTIPLEPIAPELETLLRVTKESLDLATEQMRVGNHLGDVSATVQKHVEAAGFGVVREFCGHGIGTAMHEDPQVPNYGSAGHGPELKAGMVLAVEPMVVIGSPEVKIRSDQWTAVTADGSHAAHFEHCVAVTENGPWVLTAA
jgi:methionyl aminopeptidase